MNIPVGYFTVATNKSYPTMDEVASRLKGKFLGCNIEFYSEKILFIKKSALVGTLIGFNEETRIIAAEGRNGSTAGSVLMYFATLRISEAAAPSLRKKFATEVLDYLRFLYEK